MSRIAKRVLLVNRVDEALLPMIATAETVEEGNMDPITSDAAAKNLAPKVHSHGISDVTGLQTALDGKLPITGGTVIGGITLHGSVLSQDANGDIGFYGGTGSADGGYLILFGQNCSSATYQGGFQIVVSENGNKHVLQAFKDGSIKWKGYELERINSVGSNYIRFESGVQICWGTVSNSANNTTITFPKAFLNTDIGFSPTAISQTTPVYIHGRATTHFVIGGTYTGYSTHWTAIGRWK